jgi:hypothetical protein
MEHPLDARHRPGHRRGIGNVGHPHFKLGIALVLLEVAWIAGRHIVDDAHRTAEREQPIRQMGADKSSAAGNKVKHRIDHPLPNHNLSSRGRRRSSAARNSGTWRHIHSKKMKPQSPW